MASASSEAQRLGTAGAWVVAFLGFIGFGASFFAVSRMKRRVLAPLRELSRVVTAHQAGERHPRCAVAVGENHDIAHLRSTLNHLLDQWERAESNTDATDVERRVLLNLLDERELPVVVLDRNGELLATNRAAEALLASDRGRDVRDALRRARGRTVGSIPGVVSADPIDETGAMLCVLAEQVS